MLRQSIKVLSTVAISSGSPTPATLQVMFTVAIASLALATSSYAAAVSPRATCADGTVVTNAQCCKFIPIRDALINDIFEGECGEDAHSTGKS